MSNVNEKWMKKWDKKWRYSTLLVLDMEGKYHKRKIMQ